MWLAIGIGIVIVVLILADEDDGMLTGLALEEMSDALSAALVHH